MTKPYLMSEALEQTTLTPQELRAVVEKATPGPWRQVELVRPFGQAELVKRDVVGPHGLVSTLPLYPGMESLEDRATRDAHYIATFDPSLVSKLIDLWEAARQTVQDYPDNVELLLALAALEQKETP